MNRNRFVRVRLNDVEREALDLMLAQEERKPCEFIRELVRTEAQKRGLWTLALANPAQTQAEATTKAQNMAS